jgi:4-amino-4-deoxy-L-arabinose transferase-like glycosyltransferase
MTVSRAARVAERAWLAAALLVSAVAVGTIIPQDWVGIDEGALSLAARNVNAGYLPHRDFTYPYTGGLAFLGALTAQLFGETMIAARWVLFACFLPWLLGVWSIARRICEPAIAATVVALCATWTLPMYPAALPTWYLLFLMTAVVLALLRWEEDGHPRWIFAAGLLCGLAIVLKQTGLYLLVASGLGVLAIRQSKAAASGDARPNPVIVSLLILGFAVPALIVARRGVVTGDLLLIVVPVAAVLGALILRERRLGSGPPREVYGAWVRLLAGALVFPAFLVTVFAVRGGLGAAVDGLLRESARTVGFIEAAMKPLGVVLAHGLPPMAVAAGLLLMKPSRLQVGLSFLAAGVAFTLAWKTDPGYRAVWHFTTLIVPVCASVVLWDETSRRHARPASALVLILAAAMALQGLNQFPLGAANYFGYVAPLAFLLAIALAATRGLERRLAFAGVLLLTYALRFHRIGDVGTLAFGPIWRENTYPLPGPHAGVSVSREDAATYTRLLELVAAHGGPDSVAAGPELPALYVLSGTRRLVRQPYLFIDDEHADSAAMAAALDIASTRSVAIQEAPTLVPRIGPEARAWLANRFPNAERVGTIEFRWR